MAIIRCTSCGAMISDKANICPRCGAAPKVDVKDVASQLDGNAVPKKNPGSGAAQPPAELSLTNPVEKKIYELLCRLTSEGSYLWILNEKISYDIYRVAETDHYEISCDDDVCETDIGVQQVLSFVRNKFGQTKVPYAYIEIGFLDPDSAYEEIYSVSEDGNLELSLTNPVEKKIYELLCRLMPEDSFLSILNEKISYEIFRTPETDDYFICCDGDVCETDIGVQQVLSFVRNKFGQTEAPYAGIKIWIFDEYSADSEEEYSVTKDGKLYLVKKKLSQDGARKGKKYGARKGKKYGAYKEIQDDTDGNSGCILKLVGLVILILCFLLKIFDVL